jgi:hypothetical protein
LFPGGGGSVIAGGGVTTGLPPFPGSGAGGVGGGDGAGGGDKYSPLGTSIIIGSGVTLPFNPQSGGVVTNSGYKK